MTEKLEPHETLLRMFKGGFVSVVVYRNIVHSQCFYDTIIYRKVRRRDGKATYVRGARFKPDDLPIIQRLLKDADDYIGELINRPANALRRL